MFLKLHLNILLAIFVLSSYIEALTVSECPHVKCRGTCDSEFPPILGYNGECYAVFINECIMICGQAGCPKCFTEVKGAKLCGRMCKLGGDGCYH